MTRAPGVGHLVQLLVRTNFRGLLHPCALRSPCQWVESTRRDEVHVTGPDQLGPMASDLAVNTAGVVDLGLGRSFHDLLERTEDIRAEQETKAQVKREAQAKREAAKRQRQREERMREMVKEPNKWLRETEKLAEARGTENYEAAAEILADLREAVGGDEGDRITRQHAAHLAKKHPTLTHLKSSLRKRSLLD